MSGTRTKLARSARTKSCRKEPQATRSEAQPNEGPAKPDIKKLPPHYSLPARNLRSDGTTNLHHVHLRRQLPRELEQDADRARVEEQGRREGQAGCLREELLRLILQREHALRAEAKRAAAAAEALEHRADRGTHGGLGTRRDHAESRHAGDEAVEILAQQRVDPLAQLVAERRVEGLREPEVDEEQARQLGAAGFVDDEEVPRMRIRVEAAVDEDHLRVRAREDLDELGPGDAARRERRVIVDRDRRPVLDAEDPRARRLGNDGRDDDLRIAAQVLRDRGGGAGLVAEIELAAVALAERGEGRRVDAGAPAQRSPDEREVAFGRRREPRILDLDDDLPAVEERRTMSLGDRRGAERRRVDRAEVVAQRSELGFEHAPDRRPAERRHLATQGVERRSVVHGQHVDPERRELAELRERTLQRSGEARPGGRAPVDEPPECRQPWGQPHPPGGETDPLHAVSPFSSRRQRVDRCEHGRSLGDPDRLDKAVRGGAGRSSGRKPPPTRKLW